MGEAQTGGSVTDALGVLLGTSPGAPVSVSQQVEALVAVLGGLAARSPLILAVEDAENLDPSSQSVLDALLERQGELKLFFLVAVRTPKGEAGLSDEMAGWLARDNVHHVDVGALAPEAGRELIAATATEGALPEPCVQFIVSHCGGVALHLQQMVTAFLESCLLFLSAPASLQRGCPRLVLACAAAAWPLTRALTRAHRRRRHV